MSCSSPDSKPDWKAYALREMDPQGIRAAETHLTQCQDCREELDTLRLTLDRLSTLREEEIPRRIAFVSDKVFEPRWWQRVFSPTFAAGALVAVAILVHGAMQPSQIPQAQVDAAVARAVAPLEARHAQEMQVLYEYLDVRNKQVANFYVSNAAILR